jgi:hypothetical protein
MTPSFLHNLWHLVVLLNLDTVSYITHLLRYFPALQMDAQLAAVGERLSGAVTTAQLEAALTEGLNGTVTAEQLEAALEQLRIAAADASERYELAAGSVEEMRAELILLTGQQDVVQSRVFGLESIMGVDARSSPLGRAGTSSSLSPTIEEDEGQDGAQGVRGEGSRELRASIGALSVLATAGSLVPGGRGLLELVAELHSRFGGLEGALEAAATDLDQVRRGGVPLCWGKGDWRTTKCILKV